MRISGSMPPYFPEGRKIQAQNGAFDIQAATANLAAEHRDTPYYHDGYSLLSQMLELAANPKAPGSGTPFRVAHTAYQEHLKLGPSTAFR